MREIFYSPSFGTHEISLYVSQSGHAKMSRPWTWETNNPPFSRLYYMLDGEASIIVDGKLTLLRKGYVYLLPTGYTLKNVSRKHMEQLFFHVNMFDFAGFDILSTCKICEGTPVDDIPELIRLYKSDDAIDILQLKQRITYDCIQFLKKSQCTISNKHYSENVRKTIDYVKQNLSSNLSVKEICKQLLIPKTSLNQSFRKEIGKSVGEYIDDMVLEKSKTMLITSAASISEISDALGFCDQFYFSRKFKETYGETPSSYRKNNFTTQI